MFKNYVELAKEKTGLTNNQLAKEINISNGAMSLFLNDKSNPSPETTLKLSKIAGLPNEDVVIDIMMKKYSKYPNVKQALENIKKSYSVAVK